MEKEFVDELYHQLRLLNMTDDIPEKEAIAGIVSHLTNPKSSVGDYTGLLRFLSWYGEEYLLDKVMQAILSTGLNYERVVDLGAGFGWLGRGVARLSGNLPTLFVDKRQWPLIDIVADIETVNGMARALEAIKPKDLIVMSELIHCLNNPGRILAPYMDWPIVAVEYHPICGDAGKDMEYQESYNEQIEKFNCTPIVDLASVFPKMECKQFRHFPYTILVAQPKKSKRGERHD